MPPAAQPPPGSCPRAAAATASTKALRGPDHLYGGHREPGAPGLRLRYARPAVPARDIARGAAVPPRSGGTPGR